MCSRPADESRLNRMTKQTRSIKIGPLDVTTMTMITIWRQQSRRAQIPIWTCVRWHLCREERMQREPYVLLLYVHESVGSRKTMTTKRKEIASLSIPPPHVRTPARPAKYNHARFPIRFCQTSVEQESRRSFARLLNRCHNKRERNARSRDGATFLDRGERLAAYPQ